MSSALALLTIEIGIDPEIRELGGLLLTWHGVFTALGIAAGVFVAIVAARRLGFIDDDVYSVALIAIPAGIIGARALFVAERWGAEGLDQVADIFRINEGGISVYGAVLGGIVGGVVYGWFRKFPIRRGLDVAAFGALMGMAVGRIGDLINGEHFAEASSLPWAVRYTNLGSPSTVAHPQCGLSPFQIDLSALCAQHPAVIYEMIGDLLILGLLFLVLRTVHRDGIIFFGFLFLYSLMRLGISELRLDSREVIAGLTTPQVIALSLIPISLLGLLYSWRWPGSEAPAMVAAQSPPSAPPAAKGS